jgi:homoserine trans-succinylase
MVKVYQDEIVFAKGSWASASHWLVANWLQEKGYQTIPREQTHQLIEEAP